MIFEDLEDKNYRTNRTYAELMEAGYCAYVEPLSPEDRMRFEAFARNVGEIPTFQTFAAELDA